MILLPESIEPIRRAKQELLEKSVHFLTPFSTGGRVGHGGRPGRHGEVRVRPGGPAGATTFQWQDMLCGDLMLMSGQPLLPAGAAPRQKPVCRRSARRHCRLLERDLFRLGSGGR